MAQLGYTWYPKDWFTSTTRKRLKRFPMVRYAMRELFDLMYMEGSPIEMNKEYLFDDLDIDLNDKEYEKLLEYITIDDDGKWWIDSIKKRISKAEASRENGKKGGRPKGVKNFKNTDEEKTQKPKIKTQEENPKNPPLERERESKIEKETKKEIETKTKEKDDVFLEFICNYFSQTTEDLKRGVWSFLNHLKNKNQYQDFINQTRAYVNYKKLSDEKIHGWLGYQAEWQSANWIDKLNKLKNKNPTKKTPEQLEVERRYSVIPRIN